MPRIQYETALMGISQVPGSVKQRKSELPLCNSTREDYFYTQILQGNNPDRMKRSIKWYTAAFHNGHQDTAVPLQAKILPLGAPPLQRPSKMRRTTILVNPYDYPVVLVSGTQRDGRHSPPWVDSSQAYEDAFGIIRNKDAQRWPAH